MDKYIFFYKEITGFEPYGYQIEVAKHLFEGKNVILSVPTGAGKTWASILPFLYGLQIGITDFPQKMIYSLPLRTLCNSIFEDVENILDNSEFKGMQSIQTGEYSNDKYFESDIIFSTIDQTLSNFLCFPLPLSQRQANINAGALIGSYLIFDEFHLLDEERAMSTSLGMLRMLGNLTRSCIMTATLSSDFMNQIKNKLSNFEIVTLEDFPNDKKHIKSLLPNKDKKNIQVTNTILSVDSIISKHHKKTIVICNRVETAQKLYYELVNSNSLKINKVCSENIICMHSRFFDNDRKTKEKKLKKLFGKDADFNEDAILISTQVIEAGMDISCDIMHTEISPINSFLQRAGRCARFSGETGVIYVYDILSLEDKEAIINIENNEDEIEFRKFNNKYLPYDKILCEKTINELLKIKTLDGDIPQQLVELILRNKEKQLTENLEISNFNYDKILDSWECCEKNHYRRTIRDIHNVDITIINDAQCEDIAIHPYKYQSLGMFRFSLSGWLKKRINGKEYDKEDWVIKKIVEVDDIFLENTEEQKYELKTIPEDEFYKLPQHVYVNAKYFGYSEAFGFNYQYPETKKYLSPIKECENKSDVYDVLKKDTFYQHNMALIGAFNEIFLGEKRNKMDFVYKELSKYIEDEDLGKIDFNKLIKLMIVLHDYGKLNETWQRPMQEYQSMKENINDFNKVLAHTDFDINNEYDKVLAKKAGLHKRGNHAGIGAFALQELLYDKLDNDYILSGLPLAIARHHSPFVSSFQDFKISDEYYCEMLKLLNTLSLNIDLIREEYQNQLNGFEYDDWEKEQIVYLFFARILRLCDQKATENYKKFFKNENDV